jgi:hypothetical protein
MANVTYTVQNKNGSYDGDMVVKQLYYLLIIDSGDTVTTDQPCRGLCYLLSTGDFTVNGTLNNEEQEVLLPILHASVVGQIVMQ